MACTGQDRPARERRWRTQPAAVRSWAISVDGPATGEPMIQGQHRKEHQGRPGVVERRPGAGVPRSARCDCRARPEAARESPRRGPSAEPLPRLGCWQARARPRRPGRPRPRAGAPNGWRSRPLRPAARPAQRGNRTRSRRLATRPRCRSETPDRRVPHGSPRSSPPGRSAPSAPRGRRGPAVAVPRNGQGSRSAPRPRSPGWADAVVSSTSHQSAARTARPPTRCAVTIAGRKPRVTVHMPSRA